MAIPVSLPAAKYNYCAVAYATACMHAFLAEICIQGTLLQKIITRKLSCLPALWPWRPHSLAAAVNPAQYFTICKLEIDRSHSLQLLSAYTSLEKYHQHIYQALAGSSTKRTLRCCLASQDGLPAAWPGVNVHAVIFRVAQVNIVISLTAFLHGIARGSSSAIGLLPCLLTLFSMLLTLHQHQVCVPFAQFTLRSGRC